MRVCIPWSNTSAVCAFSRETMSHFLPSLPCHGELVIHQLEEIAFFCLSQSMGETMTRIMATVV